MVDETGKPTPLMIEKTAELKKKEADQIKKSREYYEAKREAENE